MFSNLTVVELASVLAGPAVGMFFAEMGARVVKVENKYAGGDITRTWKLPVESPDALSAYYCSVNWQKEIIFADLLHLPDRQTVYQLLQTADVVITNFKHGDDIKFDMDYETLKQINPKLIYGQITAFGTQSDRVGFDVILQAESGFMYMTGTPESGPLKMPVALIDLLAAHQLKEGILAALWQREKTGLGCRVHVSLFDAAVASLANQATNWLMCGHVPQPMGTLHPNIAPYGEVFTTADAQGIVLAVGSDKQFAALCRALKLPHLATDVRFAQNVERVKNRHELYKLLMPAFAAHPRQALLQQLLAAQVPAGAIRTMPQVFELPEAQNLLLHQTTPQGQPTTRVKTTVFTLSDT
ncbi:CoA transferase [Sphingobacteriales bacterium UPWRP_1]|nr:carnitine dehydratase [Sphingobacteriales bacterium TSM_CSS]PSJ73713.1 CoA transferase [Sphingobacteriales bacterium UPWRP_1]